MLRWVGRGVEFICGGVRLFCWSNYFLRRRVGLVVCGYLYSGRRDGVEDRLFFG